MAANNTNNQIISYFTLRKLIGLLGIFLPLLLIAGNYLGSGSWAIEYSISDYYDNTAAGDILVGVLFVLGFFLLSYKGYDKIDDRTSDLGCLFALGVALFPTTSKNNFVHIMHFVFALLLFSVFIFFALYLFRKTTNKNTVTAQKQNRNKLYLTCGIIMVVCVVGIALFSLVKSLMPFADKYNMVFWLEAVALICFGVSWITKGELILKDE